MIFTLRKTALINKIRRIGLSRSLNMTVPVKRRIHSLINNHGTTLCVWIIFLHLRLCGLARHDESRSFLYGLLRFEVVNQSINPWIIGREFFVYHIVDGANPSY